jgi:hypothetical protein
MRDGSSLAGAPVETTNRTRAVASATPAVAWFDDQSRIVIITMVVPMALIISVVFTGL